MTRRKTKPLWHPWDGYEVADILAIQALENGTATDAQQKRALGLIVNKLAATYDEPFNPESGAVDGRRVTDYALGKRSVGLQIVKLLHLNAGMFEKQHKEPENG